MFHTHFHQKNNFEDPGRKKKEKKSALFRISGTLDEIVISGFLSL